MSQLHLLSFASLYVCPVVHGVQTVSLTAVQACVTPCPAGQVEHAVHALLSFSA